jgi:hypothetical protein
MQRRGLEGFCVRLCCCDAVTAVLDWCGVCCGHDESGSKVWVAPLCGVLGLRLFDRR